MSRKVQVRFLGDRGGVTRLGYPTRPTTTDKNISILTKPTLKFVFLKSKWRTRHT